MRHLLWMAEGHGRDAWGRVSLLCALIGNAHRDPKKGRAFKPADFDPYPPPAGRQAFGGPGDVIEIDRGNIGLLKEAFAGAR